MNKIKTFFTTLYRSSTDPGYYSDVVKAEFSFSFKYFTLFYIFLSLIISGYISAIASQRLPEYIDTTIDTVSNLYPEDLKIHFDAQKSTLTTEGVDEPIIIPMPVSENIQVEKENLLVIDTSANAEKIDEYQSAILLTNTHLATITDESIGFQIIPFTDISEAMNDPESGIAITNITIDKSLIIDNIPLFKTTLNKLITYLPYLLFFASFFFFILSRLFILLVLTVFTHLSNLILGKNLSYSKVYQLGLHTITITDVIIHLQKLVFHYDASLFGFIFIGISTIAMMGIKTSTKK